MSPGSNCTCNLWVAPGPTEIVDWGERTAGSESRRARNRRHRSAASTAVTAGTSRPLPAPPPPHKAGYVPRLRPGTGRQPAAARPGSTVGREGGTKFSASCVRDGQTASCAEISNLGCNGSLRLSFRMRCGCSGRRSECERFDGSNGSRAGSVPLALGPSQYPGHTGRVSTPGTRAESVPLAHGPSQYPWHTGRVSTQPATFETCSSLGPRACRYPRHLLL